MQHNLQRPEEQPPEISNSQEKGNVKGLENRQTRLEQIMIAFIVVLFIGFAGMFVATATLLIDSYNNKSASYDNLQDTVQTQNTKVDQLIQSQKQ